MASEETNHTQETTPAEAPSSPEPNAPVGTRVTASSTEEGKIYRVEVTGYSSPEAVNRVSKFRRSNQVFLVPYNKLSQEYQRIHKEGGVITKITPV